MKGEKKLVATLCAAGVLAASGVFAAPSKAKDVTVTILRVAQVDNLDKGDALGKDDADFYVQIWINGKLWRSENMSKDDGRPNWTFSVPASKRNVPIRIKLIDDDGGLEEQDDFVDINRRGGKKDLNLTLNTRNGRITGDVSGRRGKVLRSWGGGDTDKAQIWLMIH